MPGTVTFDLQNLLRRLDTLDAKGANSRNFQSAWAIAMALNSWLLTIQNPDPVTGTVTAGHYILSEDWAEANRVTYESEVDATLAALTTVLTNLKLLVKA